MIVLSSSCLYQPSARLPTPGLSGAISTPGEEWGAHLWWVPTAASLLISVTRLGAGPLSTSVTTWKAGRQGGWGVCLVSLCFLYSLFWGCLRLVCLTTLFWMTHWFPHICCGTSVFCIWWRGVFPYAALMCFLMCKQLIAASLLWQWRVCRLFVGLPLLEILFNLILQQWRWNTFSNQHLPCTCVCQWTVSEATSVGNLCSRFLKHAGTLMFPEYAWVEFLHSYAWATWGSFGVSSVLYPHWSLSFQNL